MKDIKFRIWNKTQKEFVNPYRFGIKCDVVNGNPQILESRSVFSPFYERYTEDFEIQQYTGLKDKNNKEIYEGDICKCRGLGTIETVIVKDIRQIPVQVSAWPTIYGKENGECEVIGNIYQNPELLKN
jgi:hypothetical protein